ncbi:WSC domain-containing protein [Colletotrichum asianum]|uniref:WSC domain-containing protein n=1 Tax=Colletotrichum asianum TaxID=702518 RepID=A0A8H3W7W5_9PEZI|nr:WSC domain-containing protein [Colletotrichum asianum]
MPSFSVSTLVLLVSASGHAAYIAKREVNVGANLPNGWTYKGCYTDGPARQLARASYADPSMTEESCVNFCQEHGFPVAGVEYSSECWCDYRIPAERRPETDCNMVCSGDSTEYCGAGNRLTVFSNGGTSPAVNPGPSGWTSLGCYTDSGTRTLSYRAGVSGGGSAMSVLQCTTACTAVGFAFAGVEYGTECWCDDAIRGGASSAPEDDCNMLCGGNNSELCGGPNRINLYKGAVAPKTPSVLPTGWKSHGCLKDNIGGRSLGVYVGVEGGNTNVANCIAACAAAGYTLAGVEYAQECWCDNSIRFGGVPTTDGCNMPCKGNTAEMCGDPDRLNLYSLASLDLGFSTTSSSAIVIPSSSSTVSLPASSTSTSITSVIMLSSSSSSIGITLVTPSTTLISIISTTTPMPTSSTLLSIPTPSSTSIPQASLSTSSTAPAGAAATACTRTSPDSAYVKNAGFESGLASWAFKATSGDVTAEVITDNHPMGGYSALMLTPRSSPSDGVRRAVLRQTLTGVNITEPRAFAGFFGRLTKATIDDGGPQITVNYGGVRIYQWDACGSSQNKCNLNAPGTLGYYRIVTKLSLSLAAAKNTDIVVEVVWSDTNGKNNPVLLDDIILL